MTGQELQALAAARNENPYFLGYALATGADGIEAARVRDGGNHEFMIWNGRRWNETAARNGVPRDMTHALPERDVRHCEIIAEHVTAFDYGWPR